MECKICSKILFSMIKCKICDNIFCSNYCLESHITLNHKSINSSVNQIYEKPKIERINNNNIMDDLIKPCSINSPYITNGLILTQVKYDSKYNLQNFIPILEYNSPKIIGIGSYGKVYLYKNIKDNKLYAIKHLNKMILCKSIHTIKRIYDEINIQSRIFHQNIVKLLNVIENDQNIYLIMEYASNGSLFNYIRQKKCLSEEESFRFFSQIINAIYFLHRNDFIHRDIKPENILIFDNNVCKLCDFGCCVELNGKQRTTFCGTTEYMSPEILNKMEYSKEIDIWSLGILLYEMVHGYSPFNPYRNYSNQKEIMDKIKVHDLKFNINLSNECRELICHLLDKNAKNRYKIEDIFESKFINKYEKMGLYYLNDKFNINNYYKINYSATKCNNNNNFLLSSLIENENIINKTLFNNIKYNNLKKSNMKNQINNVVFNNIINRNQHSSNDDKALKTSRAKNKKLNSFHFKENCINSTKEEINNYTLNDDKINVKVTKLNINNNIDEKIKSNISIINKLNNNINLSADFSKINIMTDKIYNNKKNENNIKNESKNKNENNINKINKYLFNKDNNSKKIQNSISSKLYQHQKEKLIDENNNIIKNKYYLKPKIQKDSNFSKNNFKGNDPKPNCINFKNCLNSKIKIPRRKILSSLQLDNINIFNNIDFINNNEIPPMNSSNRINTEYIQINDLQNDFSILNNIKNNTYKRKNHNRYDSSLNDNSIQTQINKNYIFNPNISINLTKYPFTLTKKRNVKIVEIKGLNEDIKDKIDCSIDSKKSQIYQKNKKIKDIKNNSTKNMISRKGNISELKNNINQKDNKEISNKIREFKKIKIDNNPFVENNIQKKIKDNIHNKSRTKYKFINFDNDKIYKSMSNSPIISKEYNFDKEKNKIIENKKLNVKQKHTQINSNLIKNNNFDIIRCGIKNNKLINNNINNSLIEYNSEREKIKNVFIESNKGILLTERINNSRIINNFRKSFRKEE